MNIQPLLDLRKPERSKYKSVYLINTPKIGLNNPPMAPALLQAIARDMGCATGFIDINLDFHHRFETDSNIFRNWCELDGELSEQDQQNLHEFIATLDMSAICSSEVIGISVFSKHSQPFTTWFLKHYKSKMSGVVVVGGAGVSTNNYGAQLREQGLVDHYVINEGEVSWRSILAGNIQQPGVDSTGPGLLDFEDVPVPNYSNFKLEQYLNSQVYGVTIGVEGSRGCVRNCTFCDIRSYWKKYKYKDGRRLAKELIHLREMYQVEHFFFNDSLVNGSDKAFRDFCSTLAEYNTTAEKPIAWSGYYIIKPAITYKDRDWTALKNSGVKSLYIGIESGSESVRHHMKKKFSNTDIDHAMQQIQLQGIRCTWLLIIGYPTETEQDFEQTLELLRRYQPMAVDRTIDTVALGMTMGILPGSPLEELKQELNITSIIPGHVDGGVSWKNNNSDFQTRIIRRIRAEEEIRALGYNSWVGDNDVVAFFEKKLQDIVENKITDDDIAEYHG
jgi:hypothetical protein